jgi:hypothetical protein
MKNFVKWFGIIALAAVIGFSMAACDDGGGNDNTPGGGTTTYSLDGYWEMGNAGYAGLVVNIIGSTGVVTQINNSSNALTQSAIDNGYLKVGTQWFRNLSKTGDRTWTGQTLSIQYYTSAPNVAVSTTWVNCTITMNANGQSFQESGNTYVRRQY